MGAIEEGHVLTVSEYLKTENPIHLAQVRCWRLSLNTDWTLRLHRYTYYLDTVEWDDHPWGRSVSGGAAFAQEWTQEVFRGDGSPAGSGRSGHGWGALRASFEKPNWFEYGSAVKAFELLATKHEESYFYHYDRGQEMPALRSDAHEQAEYWGAKLVKEVGHGRI